MVAKQYPWIFFSLVGCAQLSAMTGCKKDPTPTPVPEKAPVTIASTEPAPSASAKAAIPLRDENESKEVPTWVPDKLTLKEGKVERAFLMDDGNIAAVDGLKVGRIVDDKIEWIDKQVPENNLSLGGTQIIWVGGRFPDAVDVMYQANNGRAAQPTFYPLTGPGNTIVYGVGGGIGDIVGVARLGESTLIGGVDHVSTMFATVRGPGVIRGRKLFAEAGCKKEDLEFVPLDAQYPAIVPRGFGATGAGTVISVGVKCQTRNAAIEIWEKDNKLSKIIDLDPKVKEVDYYFAHVVPGEGDDAWIRANAENVFYYKEGRVEKMPPVVNGAQQIFMSPNHRLYAGNSWGLHRWDKDHWTHIAKFPWKHGYPRFFADKSERIWESWGAQMYREGKSVEPNDGCPTLFVHLYDVSEENKSGFTFPTTRKALATFAEVNDLTLVDFFDERRRLGLVVKTKAQGEAVVAHLKTAMPKEKPRLMCYEPKAPRKIEIEAKNK